MSKCLLSAPLLLILSGCFKAPVMPPMPLPPANLAQPCPSLPAVPDPLIDPDRAQWEADLIYAYGDCAARHRGTIDAWQGAVKKPKK